MNSWTNKTVAGRLASLSSKHEHATPEILTVIYRRKISLNRAFFLSSSFKALNLRKEFEFGILDHDVTHSPFMIEQRDMLHNSGHLFHHHLILPTRHSSSFLGRASPLDTNKEAVTRPTLSQLSSFKICRTTFLYYIKWVALLVLRPKIVGKERCKARYTDPGDGWMDGRMDRSLLWTRNARVCMYVRMDLRTEKFK